ncbi:MAG TPA: deoxyribodipyrimidine photo-lyase [Roseomonas sp.]|jgi:deoxyribodipyrimidine photo-lyase
MTAPIILWFRQDLRLADNPALVAAMAAGPVLPVFVLDDAAAGAWAPGGAARWWLHHSLASLAVALKKRGAPLLLLRGSAETLIPALAVETGAQSVQAGRLYEPWARRRDQRVAEALEALGRKLVLHSAALLTEPHRVRSGSGTPYAVYTPFARAVMALGEPEAPLPAPSRIAPADRRPAGERLDGWGLLPSRDWAGEFPAQWQPGEAGATTRLAAFAGRVARYDGQRDLPATEGTSRLSPHLHWGEISPRQAWLAVRAASPGAGAGAGAEVFLKELLWREFSHHLLWHRPDMPEAPLRQEFARFDWQPNPRQRRAWEKGATGYPIVDAGMRQLWRTGWMHNRVRMIAASFLVKHLLQPWQDGAAWFWDTLVDADLANNSQNWQWVAGCGSDAAPYFRIFNPVLQGRKFDPAGAYVRSFVPEIAALPDAHIHSPWAAPPAVLAQAGIRLGRDYPMPIIDHAEARQRALDSFAALRA